MIVGLNLTNDQIWIYCVDIEFKHFKRKSLENYS